MDEKRWREPELCDVTRAGLRPSAPVPSIRAFRRSSSSSLIGGYSGDFAVAPAVASDRRTRASLAGKHAEVGKAAKRVLILETIVCHRLIVLDPCATALALLLLRESDTRDDLARYSQWT
jgi:hypothetical protein